MLARFRHNRAPQPSCHSGTMAAVPGAVRKVAILGSPNVGKSVVFNWLTGSRMAISNYPGTTVEVSRGRVHFGDGAVEIVDTPGMYSFLPISEEERVARAILLDEKPDVVVHVVDAKNLDRMLPLALQLVEAGLPLVLQVNMMDEAEAAGVRVNCERLSRELGVPVVPTVAVTGRGMDALWEAISGGAGNRDGFRVAHDEVIERALEELAPLLGTGFIISARGAGLLLLAGDAEVWERLERSPGADPARARAVVERAGAKFGQPLSYIIALGYQQRSRDILAGVVQQDTGVRFTFRERLSRWMMHPLSGSLIGLAVLYVGLYLFVGVFGAGILVDLIEGTVFGQWLNPWVSRLVEAVIPWQVWRDLFVGEYGIVTLGLTYAFAIVFPIVGTFSVVFAIIEDSGYLPRLAMLLDRLFKTIGLNGRAVIPIVLGFGCDTMATIVTRVQETERERIITTLLLALAIPCSAQLGVIFGILSGNVAALLLWGGSVGVVFLMVGSLAARVLPGRRTSFYMELPPLRLPRLGNILSKTMARLEWYFLEVLPMFLLASVVLWLGDLTGVFQYVLGGLEPLVRWIGLPDEVAVAFLYGFFRRDFGAAGLYDLHSSGVLSGVPLVVAAVTITLFIPCIAQFLVMIRERGLRTALGIAAFVFSFALLVGFLLNWILTALGVTF